MALVHWPTEIKLLVFGHFLAGEKKQPQKNSEFLLLPLLLLLGPDNVKLFFELSRVVNFLTSVQPRERKTSNWRELQESSPTF